MMGRITGRLRPFHQNQRHYSKQKKTTVAKNKDLKKCFLGEAKVAKH
jgi:hypothetical protein